MFVTVAIPHVRHSIYVPSDFRVVSTDVICTNDIGNVTSLEIRLNGTDAWVATKLQVIGYENG